MEIHHNNNRDVVKGEASTSCDWLVEIEILVSFDRALTFFLLLSYGWFLFKYVVPLTLNSSDSCHSPHFRLKNLQSNWDWLLAECVPWYGLSTSQISCCFERKQMPKILHFNIILDIHLHDADSGNNNNTHTHTHESNKSFAWTEMQISARLKQKQCHLNTHTLESETWVASRDGEKLKPKPVKSTLSWR